MPATPLLILLTLLGADPSARARPPAHGPAASASTRKTHAAAHPAKAPHARGSAAKAPPKSASRAAAKPAAKPAPKSAAKTRPKTAKAPPKPARRPAVAHAGGQSAATPQRAGPGLTRARALLLAVKQDPVRRRYKHEWEKAIRALEKAATGRDRGPALLEAARARYALYRFSSDEGDRDRALLLARKAKAAGSADAATFIAAVRREAGDDAPARPAVATARPQKAAPVAKPKTPSAAGADDRGSRPADDTPGDTASAAPPAGKSPGTAEPVDDPPDTDPVLDRILAQLAEDPADGMSWATGFGQHGAASSAERAAPPEAHDAVQEPGGASEPTARIPIPGPPPAPAPEVPSPRPSTPESPALAAGPDQATPPRATQGQDEAGSGTIHTIVIDPGHGGHDTGAIGPTRVREKDVVLAIAKRLARKLEAQGFEVVLTRDDDRYLALAERTALANAHRGDLFVSIHANAHPRRDRTGVETWVLDVSSDRYASRLAARENGIVGDADSPMDVRRILADLDAKVSAQASRRLARVVQEEVTGGIRARFGPVRDLGVKSALFYVLLGARMPAVLVETSFISNRAEEKRLTTPRFQDEVASALTRAIGTFAAQQARVAAR